MSDHRQTKIVATLGPASESKAVILSLLQAGVNVFRLNFSHGSHDDHRKKLEIIRGIERELGRPIGVIADLQGPKLRIGSFAQGRITVQPGQKFCFDLDDTPGTQERVCLPHPEILSVLEVGHRLFLDDGKVRAKVTALNDGMVETQIETGTALSDKKGVNVPGAMIPIPALTEKDKTDLKAALEMDVDWIAQSFVQTPQDVQEALDLINGRAALMVKIEKPSALKHLDLIVALADGVMLARGDLGVEIAPEQVPAVQKRVVHHVRCTGKPIIVATQMLESMIENARPTRAEASDVATAVYDGTDAVMLSAETAAGQYPVKAVEMMDRICRYTESDETYPPIMEANHPETDQDSSDAITTAAHYVAQDIDAGFIVTYTTSGSTTLRMARQRPRIPILCLTPAEKVARRLCVSYGVRAVPSPDTVEDFTGPARYAAKIAQKISIAQPGQKFVMTAGMPFGTPGSTNILRIAEVADTSEQS